MIADAQANGRHGDELTRDIEFASSMGRAALIKTAATQADVLRLEATVIKRFARVEYMIGMLAVLAGSTVAMLVALLLRQ